MPNGEVRITQFFYITIKPETAALPRELLVIGSECSKSKADGRMPEGCGGRKTENVFASGTLES